MTDARQGKSTGSGHEAPREWWYAQGPDEIWGPYRTRAIAEAAALWMRHPAKPRALETI